MSVTYVGGTSIGQAIPGLQQALDGLELAVMSLTGLSGAEAARIAGAESEYNTLINAYNAVLIGLNQAKNLVTEAEEIQKATRAIVLDLLDGISEAGIQMYRVDAQASLVGTEFSQALTAAGVDSGDRLYGVILVASDAGLGQTPAMAAINRFFP